MANTYTVRIPFAGYVEVEVAAGSESEAITKAMAEPLSMDLTGENLITYEWEQYQRLSMGNVNYLTCTEAEVVRVEEAEE